MKGQLFKLCVLLVAVGLCCTCYARQSPKASSKARIIRAKAAISQPAAPQISAPAVQQPSMTPTAPSAETAPPATPPAAAPQPAATGAGPSAPPAPMMASAAMPSAGVAVDSSNVYVLQEGKLYKYAKGDVNACGTVVPPVCSNPCATGAGPCPTCALAYIPGIPGTLTITTCNPCPSNPPCPNMQTGQGAGPAAPGCNQTHSIVTCGTCQPCPEVKPCPAPSCLPPPPAPCNPCPTTPSSTCPATTNTCPPASCLPQSCNPCTTTTMPAGVGSGPCMCPAIGTASGCAQTTINCIQNMSGVDADRAYLQAMINSSLAIIALSDAAADHLSTTSLQDSATNSIGDARSRIGRAQRWLKSKYCMVVTASCPPTTGLNICTTPPGKEFDDAYRNQLVQYYLDEIAISQAEIEHGCDCEVKAAAATVIRQDQERIARLKRCSVCL